MGSNLSLSTIKTLIRESLEDNYCTYDGKIYVNLAYKFHLIADGLEVLFLPDDELTRVWKVSIDNGWGPDGDKQSLAYLEAKRKTEHKLNSIGRTGRVTYFSPIIKHRYTIEAEIDGDTVRAENYCFWAEVETSSPDFRPDEALPEDYYAL